MQLSLLNPGKLWDPPPKKQKFVQSPTTRATWNTANVEALLTLRYSDAVKNKYHSTKTNKQKSAFWLWFTARFNAKTGGSSFDPEQINRRLISEVAEWRALQKAEKETVNAADAIAYPDYYDVMVSCLQVKRMLAERSGVVIFAIYRTSQGCQDSQSLTRYLHWSQ